MTPRAALAQGIQSLGLTVTAGDQDRLLAYLQLLAKWSKTYNLTAIREPLRMISHHPLDSLAVVPHLRAGTLADVGAGAGLPGVPIAIVEPHRRVTLNDANQKKTAFLRQALIELGIANADVHAGRAEAWAPGEKFDCVISRGFAELGRFIATCRHLVAPGGTLIAMKGTFPEDELASVPPGVDCSDVRRLRVPQLDAERHLVLCRCAA
jgi:16S rRNA (guanine527-N7)-methyltransferase